MMDKWLLIELAVGAGALLITAGLCVFVHRINERFEHYEPSYRQEIERRYNEWRVFLLNIRIAAYRGKEKGEASLPRPKLCDVLPFPRLPSL